MSSYVPGAPAQVKKAPESKIYVLVRLPATMPAATANAHAKRPTPVEVERVYARQGSPLGFAQSDGQLIAIGGATQKPLPINTRYVWRLQRRTPSSNVLHPRNIDDVLKPIVIIAGVVTVVAVVLWVIHDDRHSLLQDLLN